MAADYSLWVHDAITGNPLQRVQPAEDAPFSASIAGDGQSSITVATNDAEYPFSPGAIPNLFTPNARLLVRWWGENGGADPGDAVVCAHKIDSWDYDRDAGKVSVQAIDLLAESKWRLVGGVDSSKYLTLTVTNRTPSGAVAQVLARMMQWGTPWFYPIDLPADAPGSFSGSWIYWKGFTIAEILDEIRKRTGVEIYLRPYATSTGGVRFQTRVGAPITIGGASFNLDADESPIAGIKYRVDGTQQLTGLQGLGNGTGEDQQTRAAYGTINIPIRDTKKSFDDLEGDALQQAVNTHYAANVNPVVQWDVSAFTIDDDTPPELVAPGRVLQLEIHDDVVIPDGVHTLRVISVSGGNGRQLKPEVQSA